MKQYKPKKFTTKKFELNKRESSSKRGYDWKWYNYRKKFLKHNPLCYICNDKANVVDHIVAWKTNKEVYFWKKDNFMPCCKKCHDTVTGKFDQFRVPKTKEKIEWIKAQRLQYLVTTKIVVVDIK